MKSDSPSSATGTRPSIIRPGDTVLFQGDSITSAFRMPDEVNNAYQMGAGYVFLVASQLMADRPRDGLVFLNRSVAGHKVSDLAQSWRENCLALAPDVLSILIGTNDMMSGTALDLFARDYRSLLDQARAGLPETRLVLCEPFVLPSSDLVNAGHIEGMAHRRKIVRELASEFAAVFVPLQHAFDAAAQSSTPQYWSYDGIHPTAPGFALIAREWIKSACES